MRHIRDDLKRKYPALCRRAYQEKSSLAAIKLFCLECVGDCRREVLLCSDKNCPLYRFRKGRLPGDVQATPSNGTITDTEEQNAEKTSNDSSEQGNAATEAVEPQGMGGVVQGLKGK